MKKEILRESLICYACVKTHIITSFWYYQFMVMNKFYIEIDIQIEFRRLLNTNKSNLNSFLEILKFLPEVVVHDEVPYAT